jgi:hypothetical protein
VEIVLDQFSDGFPVAGGDEDGRQYQPDVSAFQIVHVPTETVLVKERYGNL